jgi:hypothetical protein
MNIPDKLKFFPFEDAKWDPHDKPVLVLDGTVIPIREVTATVSGDAAYVVGVNQASFEKLCTHLRTATLQFYEMRVGDLSALEQLGKLAHLAIRWNTKLVDLKPLAQLKSLETLVLEDTPKAHDLAPLAECGKLQHLEFSGGIDTKNTAEDLSPLTSLRKLRSLTLANLKVTEGGLRPLAGCRQLTELEVSNQFDTEDYALLSVRLPKTRCEKFAPYVPLEEPLGEKDVMVVGRRKPLLNAAKDQQRLAKYAEAFAKLQQQFEAEMEGAS